MASVEIIGTRKGIDGAKQAYLDMDLEVTEKVLTEKEWAEYIKDRPEYEASFIRLDNEKYGKET